MYDEISKLIQDNKLIDAREVLVKMNVVDIAQFFEDIFEQENEDHFIVLFRILPKDIAAIVFSYLSAEGKAHIIQSVTDKEITYIIDELYLDDMVDIMEEFPANIVKRLVTNTDEAKRKLINQFLRYPEDSAGSIMTIEYVALKKEMNVAEAIALIKKVGVDKETINTCYVMSSNRMLEGVVSIRKLILSDSDVLIKDIMDTSIISAQTLDDQETVADIFKKYDFLALPVVDTENRLVGIITIDDIVDIIEEENTEDFEIMGGMQPSKTEYMKSSPWELSKNRIPWLLILMISALFTGRIIESYEGAISKVAALATFLPMLMDSGGNAGSQSSTLVIRGLALGEIQVKDFLKVLWKEVQVSLIVGFALAGANFIRLYVFGGRELMLTITVCISLYFTVIIAKMVGGVLPLAAKKLNLDPAIMASPLITTVVDALALIVYFSTATKLLGIA
ncbi:MAG TPA: magnesium transporter [Epulopiscium sp.]|nr:magnesium transporter [Candidatus Epulonipiscium sp.]